MDATESSKWEKIPQEIRDRVSPIKNHPRMEAENAHINMLVVQLGEVRGKLENVCDRANDIDADAQKLIDGAPIATLKGESVEGLRKTLQRQVSAIGRAVDIRKERRQLLKNELVKDACEEVREVAEKYALETIEALERLHESIVKANLFWQFLEVQGLAERPGAWRATPLEQGLLSGDHRFQPIGQYVKQRREVWKLPAERRTK